MDNKELTCIGCPLGCQITVSFNDDGTVKDVVGNTCKRGDDYARKEVTNPTRIVTSIMRVENGDRVMVSCKTASDIPKTKIFDVMKDINSVKAVAPIAIGDILIENVADTGVNVVATKQVNIVK